MDLAASSKYENQSPGFVTQWGIMPLLSQSYSNSNSSSTFSFNNSGPVPAPLPKWESRETDSEGSSNSSSRKTTPRSSFLTVPGVPSSYSHFMDAYSHSQFFSRQHQFSGSYAEYCRDRADSFGSTGSGATDFSSSPHDSYWSSGQTTTSRGSPLGSPPNFSPLSQAGGSSKLLNILLGNITFNDNLASYIDPDRRRHSTPHIHVNCPSPPEHQLAATSLGGGGGRDVTSSRHLAAKRSSPCLERRSDAKRPSLTLISGSDTPMDLTCKKNRTVSEPVVVTAAAAVAADALHWEVPKSKSTSATTDSASTPRPNTSTILQSLLTSEGTKVKTAPVTPVTSLHPPDRVYVSLAKRNQRHVQAHVSDWMGKITRFALDQSEFRQLTDDAALALLTSAFPRLLLISMAQTNFHFAVAPTSGGSPEPGHAGLERGDVGTPTMHTVESIESFITRCDQLHVDTTEYDLLKVTALFNTSGEDEMPDEVVACREAGVRRARTALLDYELRVHGRQDHKTRYSSLLLTLHLLSAIEPEVVRRLFCADPDLVGHQLHCLLRQQCDANARNSVAM